MFVINIVSIKYHNKFYDYEDNEKHIQKPAKISRRKCRSYLNHSRCFENLIFDLLAVFFKPMGTIIFRMMGIYFKRNQN